MSPDYTPRRACIELVLGALIWGFGFIATRWALQTWGPMWIIGLRFLLTYLCVIPWLRARAGERVNRDAFRLTLAPGLAIAFSLVLQTWGLKYTSTANSGFITVLYILFVPILEWVWLRRRLSALHGVCVLIALIGAALICQWHQSHWNVGDFLTLGCAFLGALHILLVSAVGTRIPSPFVFNAYQSLWAGVTPLTLALFLEPSIPQWWPPTTLSIVGILFLALVSSLIAFQLQIRAQRVLSPSTASLLFLLESPFAAFFGWLFFSEQLEPSQWVGATLVIGAAIGATRLATNPTQPAASEVHS